MPNHTMYIARSQKQDVEAYMRQEPGPSVTEKAYLAAVYQQYAPALFAYLHRHTHSLEDTEDLLLEVFLAALERPSFERLQPKEQEAWLWCVARNKKVDYLRKQVHRRGISLQLVLPETYEQDDATPESHALRQEEYRQLQSYIQRLPAIQQKIVHL